MTSGPRRYRAGYRNQSTGDWLFGIPSASDAVVGYFDPDTNQWYEGVADILSGEWIPVAASRASGRDCPPNLPVKGNLPSRVYHVPGQPNYDRVIPEVCFANEEAASDGGFRPSRSGEGLHGAAAGAAARRRRSGSRGSQSTERRRSDSTGAANPPDRTTASSRREQHELAVVVARRPGDRRHSVVALLPASGSAGTRRRDTGSNRLSSGRSQPSGNQGVVGGLASGGSEPCGESGWRSGDAGQCGGNARAGSKPGLTRW